MVQNSEASLRDYVSVFARRKFLIIVPVAVAAIVAVALSALQTPVYAASSEVLVQPRGQDALFEDQQQNLNDRAIQTEIQVIEGEQVRDRVAQNLGLDQPSPRASADSVGQTDVIRITVRDENSVNAAVLADEYARAYIEVRQEQAVTELLTASAEVQAAIDDLQVQIDALELDDPRRAGLIAQAASFQATLDELRVDAALRTGGAVVIRSAAVPTTPVEPTPVATAMLAAIFGLVIGVGAAFLVDLLDNKVRTDEQLQTATGVPVLAVVPVDPPPDERPIAMSEPSHDAVEAYRG
ncbi:MAG: Wzz/FepE/Etk N-terminal domain-containing protein, partial [Actinomycetota bacterium]